MFRRRRRSLAHLMFATLGRFVLAVLTAQLSIAATLIGWDAMVRRRRAKRESVRTTDPVELPVADSTTTTYTYGEDLYAAMLEAIAGAQKQILLESYIWKGDSYGERFRQALIDASNRGVEVFVIYDGFANLVVRRSFYDFPAPIHVMRYPAVRAGLIALNIRKSGRDHRKILVVDDHIGFVGGYNIGDVYATEWRDTHLRIVGPSAWELRNAFVDFWNTQRGTDHPALLDHGS
ncbi:MAG TPA: phospholipase D-like domain-containing protein, partial [Jiangellaceae bacterium]|nr:phospholipase D-like domain-containing protein [Jiangellaceae bacterium]